MSAASLWARRRAEHCLSDLVLDRLLAKELPENELNRAFAHLDCCATCTERCTVLQEEREQFSQAPPRLLAATEAGAAAPRRKIVHWWSWVGGGAALAAAAMWLMIVSPSTTDGVRIKGSPVSLSVIAQSSNKVDRLLFGAGVRPGTKVRFEVSAVKAGYLAILALDTASQVSLYAPMGGGAPIFIEAGAPRLLAGAILLDETLGDERIVAVLCPSSFDLGTLQQRAQQQLAVAGGKPRATGRIAPPGCEETEFLIHKVP